jgi:hypothetical protein
MSNAALFPSMPLRPAINPDGADSTLETSRPTGTITCSRPVGCSMLDPGMGPGPFWPKK